MDSGLSQRRARTGWGELQDRHEGVEWSSSKIKIIVQCSANGAESLESLYLVQYPDVKALLRYDPCAIRTCRAA